MAQKFTLADDTDTRQGSSANPLYVSSTPATVGPGTGAAAARVVVANDDAMIGIVTETAPATDTASSGLNGRLQRIAQRLTSMIALLPAALTALGSLKVSVEEVGNNEYETVAASATDQILGATGAVGDYLSHLLIVPDTTAAGTVAIKDGNGTAFNVFVTGTLSNLVPFSVPIAAKCVNATTPGWKVTTGANVRVFAVGNFT